MFMRKRIKQILKRIIKPGIEKETKELSLQLINNKGKNKIILMKKGVATELTHAPQGLSITIKGNNNTVIINENVRFFSSRIYIKNSNSKISIGNNSVCNNLSIYFADGDGQSLILGKSFLCYSLRIQISGSGVFHVGDNCFFSYEVSVLSSDRYSLLDKESGNLINYSDNAIEIGPHTLVGIGVVLTKKAGVAGNSIIEDGTVLTKKFDEKFIVVGGNPATIIKHVKTINR
jgi:acetyltransferase-like isoleucine patch superfamily enzyme